MDLLPEMRLAGIAYTISSSFANPSKLQTSGKPSTTLHVKIFFPDGPPLDRHFRASIVSTSKRDVTDLLIATMRDDPRAQPLMKKWFEACGNVPVMLSPALAEVGNFSEVIHTAMRKASQSVQTNLVRQAICDLSRPDRHAFWELCKVTILAAVVDPAKPPTRRYVATTLREAILQFFDERDCNYILVEGERRERTSVQRLAFLTVESCCKLIDMDDWMWGWLSEGFVLNDIHVGSAGATAPAVGS